MRFAISSDDEEDGLYHYLPDGGNLTACGLEAHQVMTGAPADRNMCRVCQGSEKAGVATDLRELNDEELIEFGWDLLRESGSRHDQLLVIGEAYVRGLPVCRGTKQGGPHVAIPLLRQGEQSIPCPLCGDVKFN